MAGSIASNQLIRPMRSDRGAGVVASVLGMFSPFSRMSRELQERLQLDRAPSCRVDRGRLEILVRGAGMTDAAVDSRVALAQRLTSAARPLLLAQRKRAHKRYAARAIAVVFEDEAIAQNGIATTRFTFVASHDSDAAGLTPRARQGRSEESGWPR